MSEVSIIKSNYIVVEPTNIKRATKFTCMGWISNITIPDEYPLVLLSVSDRDGLVDSDKSIRVEIKRHRITDFKLQFSHSESQPVEQTTGVVLNDKKWHLLTYVCVGDGEMRYYVDGIECPPENGISEEGMPYDTAWSRYHRLGGGNVWVPYLYRDWQSATMYKWRYASGLVLHQQWINEIKEREQPPEEILE